MQIMSTEQLIDYCNAYAWKRQIKQLHVHHTWQPDHADYNGSNGLKLVNAMRDYHMKTLGWREIGQHLTLLPDGQWVTGRDWNDDPASIAGWNTGAFAIEMVGNFDIGHDKFGGKQAESMFLFCRFFAHFKGLDIDTHVKFHRDSPTAYKTCPGTGIDRTRFMDTLKGVNPVNEQKTLDEILKECTDSPEKWQKGIKAVQEVAQAGGDLGELEIFKFLPDLLMKIYNRRDFFYETK